MKLVFTEHARWDLIRLRRFIGDRSPNAARRAAAKIKNAATRLGEHPLLGRPVTDPEGLLHEDIREITIPFGANGYLIRYQVLPRKIRILRVWHMSG